MVSLSRDSKHTNVSVHRAVLMAFRPLQSTDGMQARHLNGLKTDNRLSNLAWGTGKENADDKARHGTGVRGSAINTSVLTEDQARNIKSRRSERLVDLAAEFGVSSSTIWTIRHGKTWKHLCG